ncbi:RluA family pseudouridine synthase [Muricoccus radiodurans]|uniref:RluA family pseudouridine synthase n=1 Tax=Muricoccus radiodurans TaxID=2231721 RepID=UPI003CF1F6C2
MPPALRTVSDDEADLRLDRWFRRHHPNLTQGALQKMLRTGQVRVDGKRAETGTRLMPGQQIRVPPLPEGPPPAPDARKAVSDRDAAMLERLVIYRDDSVIALDKPHGLPVQGGPNIARHLDGMLDALRFGADDRPRLVHRLDRDTSGVLLLARTPGAAAKLAAAFRGRDARKTYWALVVGRPHPLEGRIDMPLAKTGGPRGERITPAEDAEGTRAVTDFRVVDNARKHVSWLEMHPLTGRTHQLRVHAASALKTPILGDGKYGGAAAHIEGMSGLLHLHARAIEVPHPEGGTLSVSAALPPHMDESFAFLGFDRPKTPVARRGR